MSAYLDNRRASTRITQRRGIDVQHNLSNEPAVYAARTVSIVNLLHIVAYIRQGHSKAVASRRSTEKGEAQLFLTAGAYIPDNLSHEGIRNL